MAAAFRASANASTGGLGLQTLTVNKPAGSTMADVLIARLAVQGGTNVRVLPPLGWALVRRVDSGTALCLLIYTKQGASGDPANWTWVFDSARNVVGEIATYYNNSAGHYIRLCAESGQATASGTSHAAPLPAQNVANSEIVTAFATLANTTWTPPSGETEREDVSTTSGANDVTLEAADEFSASIAGSGTKTATSAAAAVGCTWCGLLAPDGVVQPNGPGTQIFAYDDAFAAAGSSVGFNEFDLLLGFPNEFEEMIGRNTGLQFSTGIRKFFQTNVTITLGGQASDGNNLTTFVLTRTVLAMRSPMSYRIGGGPIATNFGVKRGLGPQGLKPATMAGTEGVDIVSAGAFTMRGDYHCYGGTFRGSGAISFLTDGATDIETAGNLIQGNTNSVLGNSGSVGRHYNNIITGSSTINVLSGILCQDSDGIIVCGAPTAGSLLSSTTQATGNLSRVRFGGASLNADVQLGLAGGLSGFKFYDCVFSGQAPTPVRLTQAHAAGTGPVQYKSFNTKVVDPSGNPVADIPVRVVADVEGLAVDTKTFSDGDLGFIGGGYQNGVLIADHYQSAGVQLRRDRLFTIYVNAPGGSFPVNPAYASFQITTTWPGATTGDFQDMVLPVQLRPVQGPTANFGSDKGGGTNPLPVQFTDESLPGDSAITSWFWDFGDSQTSALQNPSHSYTAAGTYTVALTVTTAVGQSTKSYPGAIYVQPTPIATIAQPYLGQKYISLELKKVGKDVSAAGNSTKGAVDRFSVPVLMGEGSHVVALVLRVTIETGTLPGIYTGIPISVDGESLIVREAKQTGDGALTEILCSRE